MRRGGSSGAPQAHGLYREPSVILLQKENALPEGVFRRANCASHRNSELNLTICIRSWSNLRTSKSIISRLLVLLSTSLSVVLGR